MIAACLIFRDAAPYLAEWLLFHLAAGIDRFYLYDNGSRDDCREVLSPFIKRGIVDLTSWRGPRMQQQAYNRCLKRVPPEVTWLAFIDDDEFLFASDGRSLGDALRPFEEEAGVAVCWRLYGSSGRIHREDDWVIRRFTRRAEGPDSHVKCIVRPGRVRRAVVLGHQFLPRPGFRIVDEKFRAMDSPLAAEPSTDLLRINHYLTKSIEELVMRRTVRDRRFLPARSIPVLERIRREKPWNSVEDHSATVFEPRMVALAREFGIAVPHRRDPDLDLAPPGVL